MDARSFCYPPFYHGWRVFCFRQHWSTGQQWRRLEEFAAWGYNQPLYCPADVSAVLCAKFSSTEEASLGTDSFFANKHCYSNSKRVFYCTVPGSVCYVKLIYGCRNDSKWTTGAVGTGGANVLECASAAGAGRTLLVPGNSCLGAHFLPWWALCPLLVMGHWPARLVSWWASQLLHSCLLLTLLSSVAEEGMRNTMLLSSIWKIALRSYTHVCNLCRNIISHCYPVFIMSIY